MRRVPLWLALGLLISCAAAHAEEQYVRPTSTPTVAPSPTSPRPPCCGDCDGDGVVTINELVAAVNMLLGHCP
jgi:hypothetical protein